MRVKIEEPDNYSFKYSYVVQIRDINYGGHFGNDKFLSIAHEARIKFYHFLGFSEMNIGEKNAATIMSSAVINLKKEVFHNEKLTILVGIKNIGAFNFDLIYRFEDDSKDLRALISTTIVCFDYQLKKVRKIPLAFLNKLNFDH